MQVRVVDGYTDAPLENATVVIAETGESYKTDASGKTQLIRLPIIVDTRFSGISDKPWGEVTLLVYHKDYITYTLFYTQIWKNETRNGPTIFMFPRDKNGTNEPFIVVEGPLSSWVNPLVEKFRPDDL